jgi:cation:H+ antiporter
VSPEITDPLTLSILQFAGCTLVVAVAGYFLTASADRLADRTGMGEAIAGAILLGAATSLPGIVTSAAAAWGGHADLAVSNALGGIAAQTLFLAIADSCYGRANLEHAAASAENMMQASLLITLLALIGFAANAPQVAVWGIHPVTPLLIIAYPYGLSMVYRAGSEPTWAPQRTSETFTDAPDEEDSGKHSLTHIWSRFLVLAATVATAGYFLENSAEMIAAETGISGSAIGAFGTAIVTSLPELVTSIAAVRRGALTLAVGGIIGGNAFDTLFLAVADIAYRDGSIYHAATAAEVRTLALTILMTGVLLMGLIRREERGLGKIGFESLFVILLYLGNFALTVAV